MAFAARAIGLVDHHAPDPPVRPAPRHPGALPLLIVAGVGEMLGSTASAWGARESIPIVAVMGSQFAAISAVAAYFLFGERLARVQVAGRDPDHRRRHGPRRAGRLTRPGPRTGYTPAP